MKDDKSARNYYPIFNQKGKASYFLDSNQIHVYAWNGEPVAFVEKGVIFDFAKNHLGFYDEGWLRDRDGKCVGFAEPGKGGPNPPKSHHPAEPPGEKKEPPELPTVETLPDRPPRRPVWSSVSDLDFFKPKKAKKPAAKAKDPDQTPKARKTSAKESPTRQK